MVECMIKVTFPSCFISLLSFALECLEEINCNENPSKASQLIQFNNQSL